MKKIIVILFMLVGIVANMNAQRVSLTDVLYTVGSPDIEGTVNGKIYECRIAEMGMIDSLRYIGTMRDSIHTPSIRFQKTFAVKIEIIGVGMIQIDPKSTTARICFSMYRTKSDAKHNRYNIMSSKLDFLAHFTEHSLLNDYYVSVKDYKVVTTPRPKTQPKKREPSIKLIKN